MESSTRRNQLGKRSIVARLAAVVAIAVVGVVIYLLVTSFTEKSDDGSNKEKGKKNRSEQKAETPSGYTVVAGDTLSAIASQTGVPEPRLERLNPELDPESLNAGQVLVLRAGG